MAVPMLKKNKSLIHQYEKWTKSDGKLRLTTDFETVLSKSDGGYGLGVKQWVDGEFDTMTFEEKEIVYIGWDISKGLRVTEGPYDAEKQVYDAIRELCSTIDPRLETKYQELFRDMGVKKEDVLKDMKRVQRTGIIDRLIRCYEKVVKGSTATPFIRGGQFKELNNRKMFPILMFDFSNGTMKYWGGWSLSRDEKSKDMRTVKIKDVTEEMISEATGNSKHVASHQLLFKVEYMGMNLGIHDRLRVNKQLNMLL